MLNVDLRGSSTNKPIMASRCRWSKSKTRRHQAKHDPCHRE
jgi:hypothetical protein